MDLELAVSLGFSFTRSIYTYKLMGHPTTCSSTGLMSVVEDVRQLVCILVWLLLHHTEPEVDHKLEVVSEQMLWSTTEERGGACVHRHPAKTVSQLGYAALK